MTTGAAMEVPLFTRYPFFSLPQLLIAVPGARISGFTIQHAVGPLLLYPVLSPRFPGSLFPSSLLPSAGEREQQELLSAVDDLWDRGIMVVAAAGNNGPKENSVTIPGISRKIVTIGSSDDGKSEPGFPALQYSRNS